MATAPVSRSAKALSQAPSKLSRLLQQLNQQPKLELHNVKKLKIRWNAKSNNFDHFGARHFVRDALPRIRWANTSIDIETDKVWTERVEQNIELTFASGRKHTIKMDTKRSPAILRELMDAAGGNSWQVYKAERQQGGHPLFPAVPKHTTTPQRQPQTQLVPP